MSLVGHWGYVAPVLSGISRWGRGDSALGLHASKWVVLAACLSSWDVSLSIVLPSTSSPSMTLDRWGLLWSNSCLQESYQCLGSAGHDAVQVMWARRQWAEDCNGSKHTCLGGIDMWKEGWWWHMPGKAYIWNVSRSVKAVVWKEMWWQLRRLKWRNVWIEMEVVHRYAGINEAVCQ
jgi:hypothetical protein